MTSAIVRFFSSGWWSGLTQPQATFLAASGVIVAGVIAYANGARGRIDSTKQFEATLDEQRRQSSLQLDAQRMQSRDELKAQRDQHEEQLQASRLEWSGKLRAEALWRQRQELSELYRASLDEATAALTQIEWVRTSWGNGKRTHVGPTKDLLKEVTFERLKRTTTFHLIGVTDTAMTIDAMDRAISAWGAYICDTPVPEQDEVERLRTAAMAAHGTAKRAARRDLERLLHPEFD